MGISVIGFVIGFGVAILIVIFSAAKKDKQKLKVRQQPYLYRGTNGRARSNIYINPENNFCEQYRVTYKNFHSLQHNIRPNPMYAQYDESNQRTRYTRPYYYNPYRYDSYNNFWR